MIHNSSIDRANIRTEIAREAVSELVNDLKSQHDLFRSLFYALFASVIAVLIVLLFSYSGDVLMVLWMMFVGSVIGGHAEIAIPVYATILILVLFQFFEYGSTETIVLASESIREWLQQCSINRVKRELCEGFSLPVGVAGAQCLESGREVRAAGESKLVSIRCKCSSSGEKYIKCECGYKPSECRFQRVKLKVYLILDIPVEEKSDSAQSVQHAIHLLILTLESSPLRLFTGSLEDFVKWYLRVKLCRSRMCKKIDGICKKMCSGIEVAEEFMEISPWYELKEGLFLVLQDTLRRLETCHLYVLHTI